MTIIRAQVIMDCWTLLPEHQVTNTLHFSSVGPLNDTVAGSIIADLNTFYDTFAGVYSPVVMPSVKVKLYDVTDPEPPHEPYNPGWGFSITPAGGTLGYVEEAALAISFHASPPNTARRRGRIYIGPVQSSTFLGGSTTAWARCNPTTVTTISGACAALITNTASEHPWGVYSRVDGICRNVVGGWIDNSPDTQRRRGHDADARTTFGA